MIIYRVKHLVPSDKVSHTVLAAAVAIEAESPALCEQHWVCLTICVRSGRL